MAALICFVAVVVSAGESFWIMDQKLRVQAHTDICMQITNLYSQKHIAVQLI